MARMFENCNDIINELQHNISMTMDGVDKTTGLIGFRRYNVYRFDWAKKDEIREFIRSREDIYKKCFNHSDLEQSVLSDLLDAGLIYSED